jgi:hypothetical protein
MIGKMEGRKEGTSGSNVWTCVFLGEYVYMHVYVCICMYVYIYILNINTYISIDIDIDIDIYMYLYMHIYTQGGLTRNNVNTQHLPSFSHP